MRDEARHPKLARAATDGDSSRVALLAVADRDVQVFVELGFALLGDIIADGVISAAMRTLAMPHAGKRVSLADAPLIRRKVLAAGTP